MGNNNKKALYCSGSPIDKQIGRNLYELRQYAGLSQSSIADKLGITFQQYQKYENGSNRLSSSRLFKLKHFFDVPYGRFFEGVSLKCTSRANQTNHKTDALTVKIIQKIAKLDDHDLKTKINKMIDILGS